MSTVSMILEAAERLSENSAPVKNAAPPPHQHRHPNRAEREKEKRSDPCEISARPVR